MKSLFIICTFLICPALSETNIKSEVLEIRETQRLISCSNLVRISISENIPKVMDAINHTRYPREQTLDKLVALMLNSCYHKMKEKEMQLIYFSYPEEINVLRWVYLIDFDSNIFKVPGNSMKYSNNENYVVNKLNSSMTNPIFEFNDYNLRYARDAFNQPFFKRNYFHTIFLVSVCITLLLMLIFYNDDQEVSSKEEKSNRKKTK